MYHLGFSKQDIEEMSDREWSTNISILENIRKEQAKQQPFATR